MRIAGIDLGIKKIAISIWEDNLLVVTRAYESQVSQRYDQLDDITTWLVHVLRDQEPDHVFIEDTLIGNNKNYSIRLSQTMGAVLAALSPITKKMPMGVYLVNNKTWKKEVVGNGNANKNSVKNYIEQKNSAYAALCGNDQDRFDAACIGYYGVVIAERADDMAAVRLLHEPGGA